jgi:hypothetical protein
MPDERSLSSCVGAQTFSFVLKTGRMAGSPAKALDWRERCFSKRRPKRRPSVNYRSISANCSGPDRGGIAPSRSHFSGVRKKNRWTATQGSSSDSGRFVQTRPAEGDWEAVQEMFLASRPRFVRVAYSILRNRGRRRCCAGCVSFGMSALAQF